ncbi:MAG: Gfo/Idh/MocA family oxidoreductase [Acidimicrobiia bacterium]
MAAPQVGLVGVGRWGRHILRDLVTLGCDVAAVAASDESRERAAVGGAAAIHWSVEALAADTIDGVVVATPVGTHAVVLEAILPLGVPVFVEKPLTNDPVTAARLADLGSGRVFVMDKWRYHPGILELARIARSGELGGVVGLHTRRVAWGNTHDGDVDDIWILAPHDLSIAAEILGELPTPRAAVGHAVGGNAQLVGLLGDAPWLTVDVGGTSLERSRRVELVLSDGIAWLGDAAADHVGVARNDMLGTADWERRPISDEMPLLAELRAFVEHLRGGPPPKSSVEEGVATVAAIAELRAMAGLPVG